MSPLIVQIHIPRTGGRSLFAAFCDIYGNDSCLQSGASSICGALARWRQAPNRSELRILAGTMPYGIHKYLPCPVEYITTLRDPVEQTLSLCRKFGFRDPFAHRLWRSGRRDNLQTRYISGVGREDLTPGSEELEKAKANLKLFACVGITSRLTHMIARCAERLSWARIPKTPKIGGLEGGCRGFNDEIERRLPLDRELFEIAKWHSQS